MTEHADLSDGRSLAAELGGKPMILTPRPDGTIAVTENRGQPPRILSMDGVWAELSAGPFVAEGTQAADDGSATDDELFAAFEEVRTGDAPAPDEQEESAASLSDATDEGDPADLTDDDLFNAWKASHAAERGVDLSETEDAADLALEIGQSVEWGTGQGTAHGILMELDTAMGTANVHTCEVVTAGGAGPQLSPTGVTIKVDASKLRASSLKPVGEEPVGPELSADLADDPDVGTEDDSDETFWQKVQRGMRRAGGGFGA
ncbi:MAG: hypothetical protein M3R38_12480 [Actinomycetota bacterium]|jgi:hypothetical protein|nr:hypothetical protein [Actinomycetota bacterium]